MTLSFNKLNEIAELYESIAASEQEQLGGDYIQELTASQQSTKTKSELAAANSEMIRRGGVAGSISRGLTSMFGSQKDIDKNKASDKASDARVRQAGAASVGKYYSSSDNKTYANYNDAKAAKNSRDAKAVTPKPTEQPQRQPAAAPANAKVLPSKPAGPAATAPAAGKSGMDIWKAKYANTLAKNVNPNGTQKGTGQSTMSKDAAELRSMQSASQARQGATPSVGQKASGLSLGSSQFKPATTSQATAAAPSTSPAASGSVAQITKTIASAPKPTPVAPKVAPAAGGYTSREGDGKPRKKEDILFSYQYEDAYDLVLEYLLDNGHVDTVDEAHYVMMELDAEVVQDIVETRRDPRGRPASGPMNVYANPKKPSQAHLDAVKAYDEKQKKKSPEQRKAELDAYKERQMNR